MVSLVNGFSHNCSTHACEYLCRNFEPLTRSQQCSRAFVYTTVVGEHQRSILLLLLLVLPVSMRYVHCVVECNVYCFLACFVFAFLFVFIKHFLLSYSIVIFAGKTVCCLLFVICCWCGCCFLLQEC